ncbi:MAG: hypothetical protein ACR2GW_07160 [Pyrinomonadaceae bacterium]|jgi:hypothetical protein
MPQKKTAVPETSRAVPKSIYFRTNLLTGKDEQFARYSRIYNDKGLHFVKAFKVLYLEYALHTPSLLTAAQLNLFNLQLVLGEEGMAYSIRGVAKFFKRRWQAIINDLDHLENVELLHRIKCADMNGCPIDNVCRTPYAGEKDYNSPLPKLASQRERLLEQAARNPAKLRRERDEELTYTYKWKEAMERVGTKATRDQLDEIVVDIIAHYRGKELTRQAFHTELDRALIRHGIVKTKDVVATAADMKARYNLE